MTGSGRSLVASLLALAVSHGLGRWAFGFDLAWIPVEVWHFAGQRMLLDEPARTLLCLHTQPPVLNALLWIVLAFQESLGIPVALTGYAVLAAVVWAGLYAVHRTIALSATDRLADILTLLLAVSPGFMRHSHQFFYTIITFSLVSVILLQAVLYVRSPSAGRFLGFAIALALLVLTVSLFPAPWAYGAIALVLALGWYAAPAGRRPGRATLATVAVACLLVSALPLKNLVLNGAFVSSSWQGINLTRAIPGDRSGELLAAFAARPPDASPALPATFCRQAAVTRAEQRELLGTVTPNMHQDLHLRSMGFLSEAGTRWRMENPAAWLGVVARFYARITEPSFARQFGGTRPDDPAFMAYHGLVAAVLFGTVELGAYRIPVFGLAVLPILLLASAAYAVLRIRADRWRAATMLIALVFILWTTAIPILTDGLESPRMRFGSSGALTVALALLLDAALRPRSLTPPGDAATPRSAGPARRPPSPGAARSPAGGPRAG